MPILSMTIGNIGSGKSLMAKKFAHRGYSVVNMDIIQKMVGGYRYGAYNPEKKAVYHAAEEAIITESLRAEHNVIIDRTNMDKQRRKRFIQVGEEHAAKVVAINFGPGTQKDLDRRLRQPRGIPAETWTKVFGQMNDSYEPPELSEGFHEIIQAPTKYTFHAFDFDGTIVKNKFPEIGEVVNGVVDFMNHLYEKLSNIIIIWTNRSGDYENLMRGFLTKNKIPLDFINENPMFNTGSRKIFAHHYYDDRNNSSGFTDNTKKIPTQ